MYRRVNKAESCMLVIEIKSDQNRQIQPTNPPESISPIPHINASYPSINCINSELMSEYIHKSPSPSQDTNALTYPPHSHRYQTIHLESIVPWQSSRLSSLRQIPKDVFSSTIHEEFTFPRTFL